ncbi:HNH endonuclease [Altererythrobacter sp. B11]|uniref:HNH endonuclease n=1 Tax=Altererythrobacter sp. B11 TaxID=2060312 RepID=UPI001558549A|nr:HNH endonuclease [Altererythrobacter sp. B11]
MCLELGRTTQATRVDHVIPLAHDGPDEDCNTRNLCEPHHLEVTAEQFGHAVPRHRGVGRDGRPTNPEHAWNLARRG